MTNQNCCDRCVADKGEEDCGMRGCVHSTCPCHTPTDDVVGEAAEKWVKGKPHVALLLELPEEVHIDYTRMLIEHFDKASATLHAAAKEQVVRETLDMLGDNAEDYIKQEKGGNPLPTVEEAAVRGFVRYMQDNTHILGTPTPNVSGNDERV